MNRVGDWGLTIGILYIYNVYQNYDYCVISGVGGVMPKEAGGYIMVMTIYILIGAIAKSAQIGLHCWLPNAMEAPTPVSALLHAATLVTAGVYLIIRTSPILEMVPSSLMVISGIGGMTALYGAIAGMYQNDIKRIIAYSTCSQLGLVEDNSNNDSKETRSSSLNEPESNPEEDDKNKKDKVPPKENCVRVLDISRDTKYEIIP